MPPLYLVQQNTKIRIRNRRVQVEDESVDPPEVLASIPLAQVEQVVLFGNVGLTTPAIEAFLEQNSEVIFLSQRGEYRGRLVGRLTPHVPLRREQYARTGESAFVLEMAKCFVVAKLSHQRALLLRHNREHADSEIESVIGQMRISIESVSHKTALPSLLGVEGSATAAYFRGLRRLFDSKWKFDDRNRRPPRDPVNVLLSFGYTLLAEAAASAVQTVGLDPYAGFLHELAYNRPALVLDLMEEFRSVISDSMVLRTVNNRMLSMDDFIVEQEESGPKVTLKKPAMRVFVKQFSRRLNETVTAVGIGKSLSYQKIFEVQARNMRKLIEGRADKYQPFLAK